jgi:hypothetical protein
MSMIGRDEIKPSDPRFGPAATAILAAAKRAQGGLGDQQKTITVWRVQTTNDKKFTKSSFIVGDMNLVAQAKPLSKEQVANLEALFASGRLEGRKDLVIKNGALVGTLPY